MDFILFFDQKAGREKSAGNPDLFAVIPPQNSVCVIALSLPGREADGGVALS